MKKSGLATTRIQLVGAGNEIDLTESTDHEVSNVFSDWFISRDYFWRGKNKEGFLSFESYARSCFRQWALIENLSSSRWEPVFKEFVNDYTLLW